MKRFISAIVLSLSLISPCAALTPPSEVLLFQWPDHPVQQALIGYFSASLVPLVNFDHRPTIAERLARPPFVSDQGRVGLDLGHFDADTAAAIRSAVTTAGTLTPASYFPVAERLFGPHRAPAEYADLKKIIHWPEDPGWGSVELKSVVNRGRRRIWFHTQQVLELTLAAAEASGPLMHPPGSVYIAEQLHPDGSLLESHVSLKRQDHDQDYMLYDANGKLVTVSQELGLRAPTMCFACHRHSRRFAPLKDYPEPSEAIQGFTPEVLTVLNDHDKVIVKAFREQSERRPDDTQGVYGGFAALRLRELVATPNPPAWAAPLWERLKKRYPVVAEPAGR